RPSWSTHRPWRARPRTRSLSSSWDSLGRLCPTRRAADVPTQVRERASAPLPASAALPSQAPELFVLAAAGVLAAMDAVRAQLLVQVGVFDAERLRGSRDVPVELGEADPDELALDLLAELAQALAGVAAEIDRRLRARLRARAGRARTAEVRR